MSTLVVSYWSHQFCSFLVEHTLPPPKWTQRRTRKVYCTKCGSSALTLKFKLPTSLPDFHALKSRTFRYLFLASTARVLPSPLACQNVLIACLRYTFKGWQAYACRTLQNLLCTLAPSHLFFGPFWYVAKCQSFKASYNIILELFSRVAWVVDYPLTLVQASVRHYRMIWDCSCLTWRSKLLTCWVVLLHNL